MENSKEKIQINVGDTYYGPDRDLWHVVGYINDGDTDLIVVKSWVKNKNDWTYEVKTATRLIYWLGLTKQLESIDGIKFIKAKKI